MADKIRFGVYELDRDAVELRKRGVPIRLQEQPFRVLVLLAERGGEIVTREELQERIWGNTFVDFDQSLNKAAHRLLFGERRRRNLHHLNATGGTETLGREPQSDVSAVFARR